MARRLISSGSAFEERVGYSRAVVDGEWVFVSGTGGFDYEAGTIPDDVAEQTELTFFNIKSALEKAGARFEDVVRIRICIGSADDWERVADIVGKHCRDVRPANTTVVTGFVDSRMKVEIDVTARLSGAT